MTNKNFIMTDGYQNVAARLGMNQDNQMAQGFYNSNTMLLTRNRLLLENLYRSNWVVGRGIDTVIEDMLREKLEFIVPEWDDLKARKFKNYLEDVELYRFLGDALRWGNLYGGAILVPLLSGQHFWDELDPRRVTQGDLKGFRVYDRWTCYPNIELITELSPEEGYPMFYKIMKADDSNFGNDIHWTRAFRFIGLEMPYRQLLFERYWGASVLERWYDRVVAFDSATYGGANLLLKCYLRVYKVEHFRDIMSAGGQAEENLIKSMEFVRRFETNEGFTTIDKEDDFQTFNWSFSGMDAALHSFAEQLAGALQIPLSRLMGQKPGGFSNTSDVEQQNYYDSIKLKQEKQLRLVIKKLMPILCRSCFGEDLPADFDFVFPSMWNLSDKGKSEIANLDTDTVSKLFVNNIITRKNAKAMLKDHSEITGRFSDIEISDEDDVYFNDLTFEHEKDKLKAGITTSSKESPGGARATGRLDLSSGARPKQSGGGGTT